MLDIEGEVAGYIKSCSGGYTKGEVVVHQLGPDNVRKKHLATIKHEPFTFEIGMGMSRTFYNWIRASFDKGVQTRSGEVVAADFDYVAQSARIFTDAYISEVTVPALDGASKEPAYMTVKVDPYRIQYQKRSGPKLEGPIGPAQKKWLCSNFRFDLQGLPCERVAKIDSFTWKQAIIEDAVGAFRENTKHPANVDVPNVKLTISMADVAEWQAWHEDFVVKGKCSETDEKSGSITFLAPDMETELAEITLQQVGIISLQPAKTTANEETVARFEVELYVERMIFEYKEADL